MRDLAFATLLALAAGCGGSPMQLGGAGASTGFESPNIVGQAVVHAWNSGISREIDDLFPPRAPLRALLACSDEQRDDLLDRPMNKTKQELKDHGGGNHFVYVGGDVLSEETTRAGTEDDGCKFTADVPTVKYKIRFHLVDDNDVRDESATFVKVGGAWYLFEL
jgi:hypothetical protein